MVTTCLITEDSLLPDRVPSGCLGNRTLSAACMVLSHSTVDEKYKVVIESLRSKDESFIAITVLLYITCALLMKSLRIRP